MLDRIGSMGFDICLSATAIWTLSETEDAYLLTMIAHGPQKRDVLK